MSDRVRVLLIPVTVRSHAPRFAARRTEGTAVLHPRVLPMASMPPPPPPPSNKLNEATDNYLNECAAYAAGVDSAEARLAMFRLETLAQKDLKVCAHARPAQPHTTPRPAKQQHLVAAATSCRPSLRRKRPL